MIKIFLLQKKKIRSKCLIGSLIQKMKDVFFESSDFNINKKSYVFSGSGLARGFTLVETIIYIAIIILVLGSLTSFSTGISNNREKIYVLETVHDNARVIMEEINKKVRFANSVLSPASGASSTALTVTMPTENITFSLVNGSLKMKVGSAATSTVNSQKTVVSNLVFTNLGAPGRRGSIKTEFDIAYYVTDGGVIYTYSQHLQTVANVLK